MNKKKIIYVAHQVRNDEETNLKQIAHFIKTLKVLDPSRIYIAPWVAEVHGFKGTFVSDELIDRILEDDEAIAAACDGLIIMGPRISSGMQREIDAVKAVNKPVVNYIGVTNLSLGHLDDAMRSVGL